MASSDNISMAVFCDFENVALGVRDMNYDKFDIKPVLERLLLKGSIVVKKAYCDWDRYKGFKATMHEANFELIEIPHVRQSGKNSADIRLVVDALDLCYTKAHVNTFVIVSGDSDFSPLVSKLRENAKRVIGVGVKQSTSDLLVANCDEFIFYDDLVREQRRAAAKRDERKAQPQQGNRRPLDADNKKREEMEARKLQALEMVVETFDALVSERGDTGKIWASLLKDTLKRRRPDFSETYYGFRTFGNLLEEAEKHGLFEFGRDEKSGTYVYRSSQSQGIEALGAVADAEQPHAMPELTAQDAADAQGEAEEMPPAGAEPAPDAAPAREPRRRGGRGRKGREQGAGEASRAIDAAAETAHPAQAAAEEWPAPTPDLADGVGADAVPQPQAEPQTQADSAEAAAPAAKERRRAPRTRKPAARSQAAVAQPDEVAATVAAPDVAAPLAASSDAAPEAGADAAQAPLDAGADEADASAAKSARKKSARPAHKAPSRKPAARSRRPAKPKTPADNG
jgi:uncharacterized LabA/DUF88 family protein